MYPLLSVIVAARNSARSCCFDGVAVCADTENDIAPKTSSERRRVCREFISNRLVQIHVPTKPINLVS
jgi:hypothetical protein